MFPIGNIGQSEEQNYIIVNHQENFWWQKNSGGNGFRLILEHYLSLCISSLPLHLCPDIGLAGNLNIPADVSGTVEIHHR